jgi:hypothetical protein
VTHGAVFPLYLAIFDAGFILLYLGIRPGLMMIFICNHLCHGYMAFPDQGSTYYTLSFFLDQMM